MRVHLKASYRCATVRSLCLVSLPFILLGLALAFPAGASASSPGGWNRLSFGRTARTLEGIVCANATHLWAVGSFASSTTAQGTGEIMFTSDGGATWNQQKQMAGVDLDGVACADATHAWAVATTDDKAGNATGGTILATSDGGATWTAQDTVTSDSLRSITCADDTHAWAVGPNPGNGADPILATTDGGATWTAQPVASGDWIGAVTCADDSHAWAVGFDSKANCGVILSTTDGGATWKARPTSFWLSGIACADASHVWAVGFGADGTGVGGAILATSNGGATWKPQRTGVQHVFTSVTCADATHVRAANTDGRIFATRNGGITWAQQPTGTTGFTSLTCAGTRRVWAVGSRLTFSPADVTGVILSTSTGGYSNPVLTLNLGGLTHGVMRLGKSVAAKGTVRPVSMAGTKVVITLQRQSKGSWLRITTVVRTISGGGVYRFTYLPARDGNYRIKVKILKTGANTAATTRWLTFKVR